MVGVLLRKQMHERLSYFKRNRKNIDLVGMLLSVVLVALVLFVVAIVFKQFIEKYSTIRINNVLDVNARLYEIMTIVYEIVLIISIFGSTTQLARSIFESDDRNVLAVLPIKPQAIFIAKMIGLYFSQAVLAVCVTLPLVIVFAQVTSQSIYFIVISTIASLLIPFISLGVASILCLPFYFIKRFFQSKYILFLVSVTALAAVLFVGYAKILEFFENLMATGDIKFFFSQEVMDFIINLTAKLVPANFLARLVFGINPALNGGILVAIIIALGLIGFGVEYLLYNAAIKIRVQNNDGIVFHAKKLSRPRSITKGLVYKELGAILFTPDYAFQYVSVAAILPVMVYFCIGLGESLMSSLLHVEMNLEIALLLTVLFGSLTNTFCAINISREGRSFYLQKTLPIRYTKLIGVKIALNFVVTILSVGISTIVITALGYVEYLEGAFIFFVGIVMGLAQICFATRKDLNKPFFPTEEDNTVKESNGNVSTIIVLGMITSLIIGGVPLVITVLGTLKKEAGIEGFTYLFAGVVALVILIASLLYTFIGMRKKFERLSEGD
ncbi:MAG: hypothetical protein J6R44_04645 [Clostridia bacterium]|nr:hypothetical protein [Clostridia bacterium]MBO7178627.1 hypothetical protein [Clostridia bacterium]